MTSKPVPPEWELDGLTEYLELAQQNRFATFANKTAEFDRLKLIDTCFVDFLHGWIDPPSILEPLLLLRCHSAFRVICQASMAGQVTESFVAARSCLEYAAYTLRIHQRPELGELWLNRHNDDISRKAVIGAFVLANLREALSTASPQLARIFQRLYDEAIDYGAHPNEKALSSSQIIEKHNGQKHYHQIYLHGNGLLLDYSLKNAARVGLLALDITCKVFPERSLRVEIESRTMGLRNVL